MLAKKYRPWLRLLIHIICVAPALWISYQIWLWLNFETHVLTANPIEHITDFTGKWTVRFLLITLSVTPLVKLTKWRLLVYRRLLGLYAFLYGLMHFLNYMVLDYFFDWELIIEDVLERKAITFGMLALVGLLILAATSFKFAVKKLGKKWQKLHRLIYPLTIFAVTHNYMMVKADVLIPTIHAIILAMLLSYRLYMYVQINKNSNKIRIA
ncbi:MAG: sulfoxide reductase heme-binding subunit YedZ [Kordiimonadaceae bacterium]|jgi:methionine sulfoxide reductase heme-binding subunit|nr:sulfoxide reductase heme-binding subunit YedZ [Kordiimonadaceae bacterium]MBT6031942.1 sulfoxide reductase heme-binding subunit YedZ [Kordiimonadaceae bacterium]